MPPRPAGGHTLRLTPEQYDALRVQAPQVVRGGLSAGGMLLDPDTLLVCPGCSPVAVATLVAWAEHYARLADGPNPAQLPALIFDASGDPWPLVHFFPVAGMLPDVQRAEHFAQVGTVAVHPGFDLGLFGERRRDLTAALPASGRWLVAGHLVEVLGRRQDILEAFLARPRHFRLYTSGAAFRDDGGVAGGDYDPAHERVQLGLGRLFEGFGSPRPGVAPFLHELGHMLDAFDAATGGMGPGHGLLPGLSPEDGALFDPEARRLFAAGKALEARRYETVRTGGRRQDQQDALPLGHPYVFQNDGEFIAGYLELFFRTPNRFGALNPDLYAGFSRLLRQDPRPAWPEDFAFYVNENEAAYLPGKPVGPAGITIPLP
jgi:hypothetical protein